MPMRTHPLHLNGIKKSVPFLVVCLNMTAKAQSLVDGTNYPELFGPAGNVTVDPPNGGLIGISLGGSASGAPGTYWEATATGGASASLLGLGLVETGAQVELTGSALRFDLNNSADSLLGRLDTGTSIALTWSATATFDDPGSPLVLAPNTLYSVSFDVDGSNGLLNSTLGITPQFGLEFLDGAGTAVGASGGGNLVNIIGLTLDPIFGPAVGTGRATVQFQTGGSVGTGPAGLRFTGSALVPASALGIGTNFATISNIGISQIPEPSPLNFAPMFAAAYVFRRKRRPAAILPTTNPKTT